MSLFVLHAYNFQIVGGNHHGSVGIVQLEAGALSEDSLMALAPTVLKEDLAGKTKGRVVLPIT